MPAAEVENTEFSKVKELAQTPPFPIYVIRGRSKGDTPQFELQAEEPTVLICPGQWGLSVLNLGESRWSPEPRNR